MAVVVAPGPATSPSSSPRVLTRPNPGRMKLHQPRVRVRGENGSGAVNKSNLNPPCKQQNGSVQSRGYSHQPSLALVAVAIHLVARIRTNWLWSCSLSGRQSAFETRRRCGLHPKYEPLELMSGSLFVFREHQTSPKLE